ncbi:LamG-like jellyroll fold domain-containing protein [Streptosporangium sp. NPDC048865]|uniref:LamG-like jellyroll fold domain-containing protein n=1 Tax=Streptosporangium sp. NPDC048865 TaxID=3155766 RepID=UPI00343F88C0
MSIVFAITVCANLVAPATAPATADATPHAAAPEPGLVAAYGLNEGTGTVVGDASGNANNGTAAGTSWVPGKYGRALAFDGASSLITIASSASLRPTAALTVEAWVNPSDSGRHPVLVKDADGRPGYALSESDGTGYGDRTPSASVSTGTVRTVKARRGLPVNGWHHLATTYDGSRLRLYIDGELDRSVPVTGAVRAGDGSLHIGGHPMSGAYFKGAIDEVRVYSVARTRAQIQADMNNPVTETDSPPTTPTGLTASAHQAVVQLEWAGSTDDKGVRRYDVHRSTISGFTPSDATWVGSPTYDYATFFGDVGAPSGVYYYRVVAIDTASQASLPSAQVKVTTTAPGNPPSAPGPLIGGGRADRAELRFTFADGYWGVSGYQVHRSTTAGFTPTARTRIATIQTALHTDHPLEEGTYHYRVIAVDRAGQFGPASNELRARIPDLPPGTPTATAQGGAGRATVTWTAATDDEAVSGYEVYRSTSWNAQEGSGTILVARTGASTLSTVDTGLSPGHYYYRVRAIDNADQRGELSESVPADPTTCPPADCLAAAYGMNEGTGTTVGDASGSGNTGTATETTWTTGRFGKALSFGGSHTGGVRVPDSVSLRADTALTMEAWVYPTGAGSGLGQSILLKSPTGGPGEYGLSMGPSDPAQGPYVTVASRTSGDGPPPLPLNTWVHLAGTFDGDVIRLYVNGTPAAESYPGADPVRADVFNPLLIGHSGFTGLIDEVRVYTTALTAAQIQADMNTPL